nr:unnamed protein product [Spirometra erinaceieuropaei]
MIFAACQRPEKRLEMRNHLYTAFCDLTKTFVAENREGLWKIMQKLGYRERFTGMVCQLHVGMMAVSFSAMLRDAYRDERPEIHIAYRTDGHLLNNRRMQAPARLSTAIIRDLLFAGDCALNTTTEDNMQRSMTLFASGCAHLGLTINTDKTVIINSH